MTVSLEWYIEGRVLDTRVTNYLTLEDLLQLRQRIVADFLPNGEPPVIHGLFDLSQMDGATFSIKEWLDTPNQVTFTPEQIELLDGWRIYYDGDDSSFRFLLSIFHQKEGHKAIWKPTREDALRFLAERDETLTDTIALLEGF